MIRKKIGFFEGLGMKIVDNIQVYIDDIHIRYEDPLLNLSFGITVDKIHMQSVDGKWEVGMIDIGQSEMHKLLEIKNLTVYLNPSADPIDYTDADDFVAKMGEYIFKEERPPLKENNYIIKPLNGTMKLDVNMKQRDLSRPKAIVNINIDDVAIEIDRNQYNGALSLVDFITAYISNYKYLKYRPPSSITPKSNPGEWWKYALKADFERIRKSNKKWKWEHYYERKNARIEYMEIKKKKKKRKND